MKYFQGLCKAKIYKLQCFIVDEKTYYWVVMKLMTKCWKNGIIFDYDMKHVEMNLQCYVKHCEPKFIYNSIVLFFI
jgi:hypothetical protein